MTHDMHDDGLVHSHNWAKEPPPAVGQLLRPAADTGVAVAAAMNVKQDVIEDGLVHEHGWACSERGRAAHG